MENVENTYGKYRCIFQKIMIWAQER
jgi:hypothetical protein